MRDHHTSFYNNSKSPPLPFALSSAVLPILVDGQKALEENTRETPPKTKPMPLRINLPPLTRLVLALLLAFSLLTGAIRYTQWAKKYAHGKHIFDTRPSAVLIPYLTIVPQLSLLYPWVFLTATLVEQNIFSLVVTLVTIFYGGRYLERAWGSAGLAKFLLVVSLTSNVISFAVYVLWYAITGNVSRS